MPTPHTGCSRHCCRTVLAALLAASPVCGLAAQTGAATAPAGRCDRTAATSFTYGRTGGSIRPTATRIAAVGSAAAGDSGATVVTVSAAALNGLARLARAGGFATLPVAPTRPTPNPDAARDFIELRSACGTKHVEYAAGTGAPVFRELYGLLTALGGTSASR